MRFFWCVGFLLGLAPLQAQSNEEKLNQLGDELESLKVKEAQILQEIEALKLELLRTDLLKTGLPAVEPGEEVIQHAAFALVYDEEHEQAKWVAHIIHPDIRTGNISRTNDFRKDPLISTGSATEADYFLKFEQADGSYEYDGYGYDRGHLAPSADFRWSELALSESYFYSNMSPQAPEFNRGKWAQLEGMIRGYIFQHPNTQLYVVTGPVLKDDLPKVERSVNGVSLPKLFYKVVLDLDHQRAIGFLMPNKEILYPIESFAVSIDKVEAETGIDFFPALEDALEDELEAQNFVEPWLPPTEQDDVEPIYPPTLPKAHFNTVQSRRFMGTGSEVTICGTVVSTKLSSKGNVFLNLDKKFPDQIFSITIWKDNVPNFSYEPHKELMSDKICVTGKVTNFNGTPTMNVELEEQIVPY
ncbi:MAG: DNA/RNA non-specific endonuclease, partial [Phaeodactylibacter sp.]|nr:DNA/RNA non-specific endonuclease [Phaeodactylibacter sp.]